ncbi:MAG: hypothetical protein ACYCV7_12155, partial [Acidimicrobiales bacterium]
MANQEPFAVGGGAGRPSSPAAAQKASPSSGVRRANPPVVLQTPSIGTSDPASTDHGNSASAWS